MKLSYTIHYLAGEVEHTTTVVAGSFKEAATKFGGDTHRFKEPIIAIVRHPFRVVVEGFESKEKMHD